MKTEKLFQTVVWYSEGDYMVKVENKETLRLLTKRFMKMNRARNIIAVIAIMLTSLLFTSLFVVSVSMILSKRATEIKQFMDSS